MNENDKQLGRLAKAPVPGLIVSLAIPAMVSMLVTTVYNMADTYFVSKLGTSASGAVGVVFGLMAVLQAFGFMFGQGAGSIIARSLGNNDSDKADRICILAFVSAIVFGVLIGLLGIIFINPLMRLLGSTDTILVYSARYALWVLLAAPFMLGSNVLNNILRYEGRAALSMVGLAAGALLNIFGDPLLIFVCKMGITGAGISTAVSQLISFVILLLMFVTHKSKCRLALKNLHFSYAEFADICGTGFPSLVRQGMNSVSTMALNCYAASFGGDAAVAAMSIVGRVNFTVFAVGLGLGQGYQPVAAFNYGSGAYSRVKKGYMFTWLVSQIIITVLIIICIPLSEKIVALFRDEPAVLAVGVFALQLQLAALLAAPFQVSTNMLLQSTGQKLAASILSLLKNGLYFVALIAVFTYLWGIRGVQLAQPVADILAALTSIPFATGFLRKLKTDITT